MKNGHEDFLSSCASRRVVPAAHLAIHDRRPKRLLGEEVGGGNGVDVNAAASHEKAKEQWQRNMIIVDESVEFWKKRTGAAPYTPKELENAVDFFERVTELRGRANMSFIGIIPDESLETRVVNGRLGTKRMPRD